MPGYSDFASKTQPRQVTCFHERDPGSFLWRRATVEAMGTLLLMFAISGAGLATMALQAANPILGLVVSAFVTAGALTGLIVALGASSGGHFNPLITILQWALGERSSRCTVAYVAAQCVGSIAGAFLAKIAFSSHRMADLDGKGDWLSGIGSEVIATTGLLIIVFGCMRSLRVEAGPFAVGAWLGGAIIATPSTSYANPAVVLGALVAAGPVALNPGTGLLYAAGEVVGAALSILLILIAYPPAAQKQKARLV